MRRGRRGKKTNWLLLAAIGGGIYWLVNNMTPSSTVSAGAQQYLNQIMVLQNAFLQGQYSQSQYSVGANTILANAAKDPNVTKTDIDTMMSIAGGLAAA